MEKQELFSTYTEEKFYKEAFMRNEGLLTPEEQEKLKNTTVAIAGLGGVGGIYAASFARLGVGKYHIADIDEFEVKNMNRQMAATVSTVGVSKAEAVEKLILDINPFAHIRRFDDGVKEDTVDEFLSSANVTIDALDFFNPKTRMLLHQKSREKGLYTIFGIPIGFGSSVTVFNPRGMSFEEYFDVDDSLDTPELIRRIGLGLVPALIPIHFSYYDPSKVDFKSGSEGNGPSLVMGMLSAANVAVTEALKVILQRGNIIEIPQSSQFDPYVGKYHTMTLRRGNKSFKQRLKYWYIKKKYKI